MNPMILISNHPFPFNIYKSPGNRQIDGMNHIWCNGQWLNGPSLVVSATDRGLLHGLGLFETILAVNGAPVMLDRHLNRMQNGCHQLGWSCGLPSNLGEIMEELLTKNGLTAGHARIRLSLSGGSGPLDDATPGPDRQLWMHAAAVTKSPADVAVNISRWLKNEHSPLAGLKCFSYAENLLALADARRMGFDETLVFNHSGHLCEAATANVFWVKAGQLFTPPLSSGCLPGITRAWVIEMAASLGISCGECEGTMEDVTAADEIFLTSSIRGITGVSRLESSDFPPGPLTRILRESLSE